MLRARVLAIAPAVAIAAACTIPNVTFAPDASVSDGGSGTGANNDVAPDGQEHEAGVVPDGGGHVTGCGAEGGTACDCDNNQALNSGLGCNAPEGGVDCDDFQPAIHPGQDFIKSPWDMQSQHTPAGDWNCDGVLTKQYPHDLNCGLLGCSGEGFKDNPECGQSADYYSCSGLPCAAVKIDTREQGCK